MEDSLRVFEVISTSYLELSTDQALKESAKEAAKLFQKDGGGRGYCDHMILSVDMQVAV